MPSSKPAKKPCTSHLKLMPNEGTLLSNPHPYRNFVRSLHYLTSTRPDLNFAMHQVFQFMSKPTDVHLVAAKRILHYLNGTADYGIFLQLGPFSLSAFSDSYRASDPFEQRSTTGFLVYLSYNPITWSAKKQLTVSHSSTESKYRALASTATEQCSLRQLLKDLSIFFLLPLSFGVTMCLSLLLLRIHFFMPRRNTLKWITTLCVTEFLERIFKLNT